MKSSTIDLYSSFWCFLLLQAKPAVTLRMKMADDMRSIICLRCMWELFNRNKVRGKILAPENYNEIKTIPNPERIQFMITENALTMCSDVLKIITDITNHSSQSLPQCILTMQHINIILITTLLILTNTIVCVWYFYTTIQKQEGNITF